MKTKTIILVAVITALNLVLIGKAYAVDKSTEARIALEAISSEIEKTIKFEAPKVEVANEDTDNIQLSASQFDRETIEDITMVPWMIKEVIVRPLKKSVKKVNIQELTMCLAK
jgi:hypothetical protein